MIIVMEPYDHHEDIVGIAFLAFCVFKGAASPGLKREVRQVQKIEVSVLIVYTLPLQKTSLLAARSRARISLMFTDAEKPRGRRQLDSGRKRALMLGRLVQWQERLGEGLGKMRGAKECRLHWGEKAPSS